MSTAHDNLSKEEAVNKKNDATNVDLRLVNEQLIKDMATKDLEIAFLSASSSRSVIEKQEMVSKIKILQDRNAFLLQNGSKDTNLAGDDDSQTELEKLRKQVRSSTSNVSSLISERKSLLDKIVKQSREISDLKRNVMGTKKRLKRLKENQLQRSESGEVSTKIDISNVSVQSFDTDVTPQYQEDQKEKPSEIFSARLIIHNLKKEKAALVKTTEQQNMMLFDQRDNLSKAEETIAAKDAKIQSLSMEVKNLSEAIVKLEEKDLVISNLRNEAKEQNRQLSLLANEAADLWESLQMKEEKIESLLLVNEELMEVKSQLVKAEALIKAKDKEMADMIDKDKKEKAIQASRIDPSNELQLACLANEVADLRESIVMKEETIKSLFLETQSLSDVKSQLANAEEKIEAKDKEIADLIRKHQKEREVQVSKGKPSNAPNSTGRKKSNGKFQSENLLNEKFESRNLLDGKFQSRNLADLKNKLTNARKAAYEIKKGMHFSGKTRIVPVGKSTQ